MPKMSIYLASSLIFCSLIIGAGIGYYFNPEYSLSSYDKNTMDLGQADRWLDLRYIDAMISHHRGAMLLAQQVQAKTQRQEIKDLAAMILHDDAQAIDELYQWKKDWYHDTRKVRDPLTVNLGNHDEKFDLRFLNALISHHEAGIAMTKETRLKTSRQEIMANADKVEDFLTTTGKTLRQWRKDWYKL